MITNLTEKSIYRNKVEMREAEDNKRRLFRAINSGMREPVDYSVFKKTPLDKEKAYNMKRQWKDAMKECYPDPIVRKTFNNPLCK